jgi:hypothetical protein
MKAPENLTKNRGSVFHEPATGARDLTERRQLMRRSTRSLAVAATTALMGLVTAALPLVALASNGGPGA